MKAADRLLTIVVTATLTSAAWIVFGGSLLGGQFLGMAPEEEAADAETGVPAGAPSAAATSAAPTQPAQENRAQSLDLEDTGQLADAKIQQLMIPVLGVSADELVDSFADARSGGERIHEAIDIMADTGTSVVSAAPGRIERLFRSEAGGNTIYVRSEDGRTIYYYAHLDEYAPGLREGQQIRRGQRLGTVGSTGNADPSAPHLHFAIMRTTETAKWWEPANAVNPFALLKQAAAGRADQ